MSEVTKQRVRLANAVLNSETMTTASMGGRAAGSDTKAENFSDRQAAALEIEEAAIEDAYYRNKKSGIQVGMSALSQMVNTRAPTSPKGSKAPRGLMAAKPDAKEEALDHFKNVLFGEGGGARQRTGDPADE